MILVLKLLIPKKEITESNELIVKDSISALIDILNHNLNIFKEDIINSIQSTQFDNS